MLKGKQAKKNTRGLNFYLWVERQAHDDSRSLQWVDSHSVVLCAVSSVQLGSFPLRGQPKAVKPKMGGRKLRIAVNWQVALKQQGVKLSLKWGPPLIVWSPAVTLSTNSLTFSNSKFSPHSVFMCFVWISEQTAIISLYNISWLVFITETECVYCAVRTGCLNTIHVN